MITTLDTLSWSPELVTGNAEFIELTPGGFGEDFGYDFGNTGPAIFVISNVRNNGAGFGQTFGYSFGSQYSFEVLQSQATPPAPGPGSTFFTVAQYIFPQPNTTFDPVAVYDDSGADPVIHIIGTRNTPTGAITSSSQYSDIIKFDYNTATQALTGPVVLSSGTRIRSAYDIAVLPNGNQIVVMSLAQPEFQGTTLVSFVSVVANMVTLNVNSNIVLPGQWVLLDDFVNATFLNGQVVQAISANANQFTFAFTTTNYSGAESGTAYAQPIGDVLLAVELAANDVFQGFGQFFGLNFNSSFMVPGSATIIDSAPTRTGNQFDGVSLVINGNNIELYYQSHPKIITFQDQLFSIKFATAVAGFGYNFGFGFGINPAVWSLPATTLTTYSARYADNRLTVLSDASNNRYLSETYWTQFNHPEGILGNVLVGYKPNGGSWAFHPTLGTFAGGSIVQSTMSVDQQGDVNLVYLLQPFDAIANPPTMTSPAYPLHVFSVDTTTLNLTEMPGFYNNVNFTWLRGTKSIIDDGSVWAIVGEREVLTTVTNETYTVPASPFTIQVALHTTYYQNVSVTYGVGGPALTQVVTSPGPGQFTVEPSTGLYTFSPTDSGSAIAISYQYISAIIPVYASLFDVPPIAEITPQTVTVWRGGTFYSIDISEITQIAVSSTQVTIIAPNNFVVGEQIALYGIGTATFLNGVVLTVATATSSQFTANFISSQPTFGFGLNFGKIFSNYNASDTGSAADLIAGTLIFSAAGSTDADGDALTFIWSENDPNLADVTLTPNGDQASLVVARAIGPQAQFFNVGVAVDALYPDLVTLRHPPLAISSVSVSLPPNPPVVTVTFTSPSGSIVPVTGDQVMLFGIILNAPLAPTLGQVVGGSLPAQNNLSVIVTYVNNSGESLGSGNTIISVTANHLFTVTSPLNNGSAIAYNVYAGPAGSETLQTITPQPLGSTFIESIGGLVASFRTPPLTSTALEQALNDEVLNVSSATATTFTAPFTLAGNFGTDFGNNFNGEYSALLTGFAITQFQFAIADVTVPANVAPTITFPAPQWSMGNVLATALPRNALVTITPGTITTPATQFPIVYMGISDPDDATTFTWTQTSGTPVTFPSGTTGASLEFNTNGVNINGETLGFSIVVSDGVNSPAIANFSVTVAAYNLEGIMDTLQLSRSIWSQAANVSNVSITGGVATITANNSFLVGEPVRFAGLTGATQLNGVTGFYVSSLIGIEPNYTGFTFVTNFPNYPSAVDTGVSYATVPISQRNLSQVWSPMDISVIFSDLDSIKRTSVLDGSDRYIVISPYSVLVYAVFPGNPIAVLLRRILTPNRTLILDAVQTEQDYTLVLDNAGNIFRYSTAPLIDTDNPDTTLILANIMSLTFNDPDDTGDVHILTTQSFANTRVVVLTGEDGALLLQLNTTTLAVLGILEFLTSDNLLYGSNYIQFVRWVNMDNLHTGQVLLGSVAYQTAQVTQIGITSNALTVACNNTFSVGDMIVLSGLTNATFLNGVTVKVIAVTTTVGVPGNTSFTASMQYTGVYGPTFEQGSPNNPLATSVNSGTTYETLVDLTQGQIIGTWDKSKLINQFVQTGEILFTPDSTYAGAPIPPTLLQPTSSVKGGQTFVTLTWQQQRPDLINSYVVSYAIETKVVAAVPLSSPYTFQIPNLFAFTADEGVIDTSSPISITAVQVAPSSVTITSIAQGISVFGTTVILTTTTNTFMAGQSITLHGLTNNPTLNGQTFTLVATTPTSLDFVYSPAIVSGVETGTASIQIITVTGSNNFSVGQGVFISGMTGLTSLIGQTLTVATLIGVGPTYTGFTALYAHTNYGLNASVQDVQVTSNVLTITTTAPHTFLPGTQVSFSGLSAATFLNGVTVTIVTTGASTFTANFINPNYPFTPDIGTVADADMGNGFVSINAPLSAVASNPQAGQYTVNATGLYTFNAAQAEHTETISIRQSFNTLQTVGSGATESIIVQLATGTTYFFVVEAFGLDGPSGQSNIESISI